MDIYVTVFTIHAEDGYGRIFIDTKNPAYQKYNKVALSRKDVFPVLHLIADQMNNAEGVAVLFEVEG